MTSSNLFNIPQATRKSGGDPGQRPGHGSIRPQRAGGPSPAGGSRPSGVTILACSGFTRWNRLPGQASGRAVPLEQKASSVLRCLTVMCLTSVGWRTAPYRARFPCLCGTPPNSPNSPCARQRRGPWPALERPASQSLRGRAGAEPVLHRLRHTHSPDWLRTVTADKLSNIDAGGAP